MRRNILIDLSPLKSGGGVQLAINFIEELKKFERNGVFLLLPSKGVLSKIKYLNDSTEIKYSPSNIFRRIFFEYISIQSFLRDKSIENIFTFFGSGLPHPKRIISNVCIAYPIICYPESPYWEYLKKSKKIKQKLINHLRVKRIKKANKIFVETEVMRQRISKITKMNISEISIIPPYPSNYVIPKIDSLAHIKNFLLLSGNSPHKNLWRLPSIATELIKLGVNDFKFIISMDKKEYLRSIISQRIDLNIINNHFDFKNTVHPKDVQRLYEISDAILSLSDLESFSNNYMEAWKVGLPIIASDRDFAHHICRNSAIYVEPHNPSDVAKKILELILNPTLSKELIEMGNSYLKELPDQQKRFKMIMDYLDE
jgi:glycosyltransferase involved in cell wall biosynthesis